MSRAFYLYPDPPPVASIQGLDSILYIFQCVTSWRLSIALMNIPDMASLQGLHPVDLFNENNSY